jgi:uncharacterized paraquat-inducible protein A
MLVVAEVEHIMVEQQAQVVRAEEVMVVLVVVIIPEVLVRLILEVVAEVREPIKYQNRQQHLQEVPVVPVS